MMDWKLVGVEKETDHRFLNFYTVHYCVTTEERKTKDYSYFVASRNETKEGLRVFRKEFDKPDAVLIGCYQIRDGILYLLLEKQFRPALNADVYSFPAGLVDSGEEDIRKTAERELREETGYTLNSCELLLPPSPTSEGLSDECNAVVLAELGIQGKEDKEEFEDISSRLYSAKEVKDMLSDSSILFSNSARLLILYLLERFSE